MQLADHSLVRPVGLVKDMLVRVNDLTFSTDFYVINLDMNSYSSTCDLSMLLRRFFLKTAKAVIDVDKGSLTLRHNVKVSDNITTTYHTFSSCIFFQDSGQHPKLGVLDEDAAISSKYGW